MILGQGTKIPHAEGQLNPHTAAAGPDSSRARVTTRVHALQRKILRDAAKISGAAAKT